MSFFSTLERVGMTRRKGPLIFLFCLFLFAWYPLGRADEIIVVPSSSASPYETAKTALVEDLVSEGHSVKVASLSTASEDLEALITYDTRAFIAIGSKAAAWLHTRIDPPILLTYCMVSDPAAAGLKSDPPRFGISTEVPISAQFQFIEEALPSTRTVGMLYNGETEEGRALRKAVNAHLREGWRLEAVSIDQYESRSMAIQALFDKEIDILWTTPDSTIYTRATVHTLLLTALRAKVPVFGFSEGLVQSGALMGIAVNAETQGEQVAALTHKLIECGHEMNTNEMEEVLFETSVNLIVAEQLSINLSDNLIRKINNVIRSQ